jgi:hypothetical protein
MSVACSVNPIALVCCTVALAGYAVAPVGRMIALVSYAVTRFRALLPPGGTLAALH